MLTIPANEVTQNFALPLTGELRLTITLVHLHLPRSHNSTAVVLHTQALPKAPFFDRIDVRLVRRS
jgi:hypothetical protein